MVRNRRYTAPPVLGALFAVLMVLVVKGDTNSIDNGVRDWGLSLNTSVTVAVWKDISLLGSVAVLSVFTLLSLSILLIRRDWMNAKWLSLAMGGAVILDTSIKWIVQRPRPDEVYAHTMPTTYSFPSGHALYSFVFYLTVAAIIGHQKSRPWNQLVWSSAILIVALIGISRIFLGVHYGSDVIGGYLIGATWTAFLAWLMPKISSEN